LYGLLQKDPGRRPQTHGEVTELLHEALVRVGRAPKAKGGPVPPTSSSEGQLSSGEGGAYVAQPTGVLGSLKQMSLTEILQMLEIGKKSARVDVRALGGAKGVVHVHEGQL